MVKHIIKKALGMIPRLLWWMIRGSNAQAAANSVKMPERIEADYMLLSEEEVEDPEK
jgi:hypothetical protein